MSDAQELLEAAEEIKHSARMISNASTQLSETHALGIEAAEKLQRAAVSLSAAVREAGELQDNFFSKLDDRLTFLAKLLGKEDLLKP